MTNFYDENYVILNERDDKGRSVRYLNSRGWGYERIFDDDWDTEIPAEVIETTRGRITYERHYDEVVIDSAKGIGC